MVVTNRAVGCEGRGGFVDERDMLRTVKSCGPGAATLALHRQEQSRRQRGQERPLPGEITYKP